MSSKGAPNFYTMKKILLVTSCLVFVLMSCSNNNNTPPLPPAPTFTLDSQTFTLLAAQGITEYKTPEPYPINGVNYLRSTISVTGLMGFSKSGTVSFDLYHREGTSVAGTYTIYDADSTPGFEDFLSPLERGCMGWTSVGVIFNLTTSANSQCNNPLGTVKIVVNTPTNYTVQYTGNFREYDNNFNIVRNVPASVNVTAPVDIH